MDNLKDFLPELLEAKDFEDQYIIDIYASLPSDDPETPQMVEAFFDRAEQLCVDLTDLNRKFNEAKASAFEYNLTHSVGLPEIEELSAYWDIVPERPEPLIEDVLRKGHKMLISGASKAGKSFLLMELAIAIAEGTKWLSFKCRKGRVLYINFEIDRASCINRFLDIYKALGYEKTPPNIGSIEVWNLRGKALELSELVPTLIKKVRNRNLDAIIFDPIYKIMMGDENSASDMGKFCNEFDKVATETGCSVIYAHHHAKGAMGGRKAQDRASGSGVFARDPDAILDIIELNIPEDAQDSVTPPSGCHINCSPWRLEGSLREFASFKPINFWYDYPLHLVDLNGQLDKLFASGDPRGNLASSPTHQKSANGLEKLEKAYEKLKNKTTHCATLKAVAEEIGITDRTLRLWITEKYSDDFAFDNGRIYHK